MGDYLLVSDDRLTKKLTSINVVIATDIASATVDEMIDDSESKINEVLDGLEYATIPATNSRDIEIFARELSGYVASLVWMEVAGLGSVEQPPNVKFWLSEWNKFMTRLETGRLKLYGQTPASTLGGVIVMGGVTLRSSTWTDADIAADDFYG